MKRRVTPDYLSRKVGLVALNWALSREPHGAAWLAIGAVVLRTCIDSGWRGIELVKSNERLVGRSGPLEPAAEGVGAVCRPWDITCPKLEPV